MRLGSLREKAFVTPHSRQEFTRRLANEPGHRISLEDLCFFLLSADERDVADLASLLTKVHSHRLPELKAPLEEIAEATEATGKALSQAQRMLARWSASGRDMQSLAESFMVARRELADVPRSILGLA